MSRLTEEGFDYTARFVASNLQAFPIAEALKKLQAYEDIGLEPEEIIRTSEFINAEFAKLSEEYMRLRQEVEELRNDNE